MAIFVAFPSSEVPSPEEWECCGLGSRKEVEAAQAWHRGPSYTCASHSGSGRHHQGAAPPATGPHQSVPRTGGWQGQVAKAVPPVLPQVLALAPHPDQWPTREGRWQQREGRKQKLLSAGNSTAQGQRRGPRGLQERGGSGLQLGWGHDGRPEGRGQQGGRPTHHMLEA